MPSTTTKGTKKNSEKKGTSTQLRKNQNYMYIGERVEFIRNSLNISRKEMAALLNISIVQYSKLETLVSTSIQKFNTCMNFFATEHNINPAWVIVEDNSAIPMYLVTKKDLASLITELNEQLKEQGLMVSMVPKV